MSPVIELRAVHKYYGTGEARVHAAREISLSIARGEFVAIMGASGSGKTTLMDLLGCLSRPTRGQYLLDGVDIASLDRNSLADLRNHKLGFVFQGFNLLARTTALENVEWPLLYGGRKLSNDERRATAESSLAQVGLTERAEHFPYQLSGGQRQRVAIARALVTKPQVILADEPTGNLDTRTSVEIMRIFQELNDVGNTVVVVTHAADIARYCKRQLTIQDGQIVRDVPVVDRLLATNERESGQSQEAGVLSTPSVQQSNRCAYSSSSK